MKLNLSKIIELEMGGVNRKDYPDFSDAFVVAGLYPNYKGGYRNLTDAELNFINDECGEFVNEKAHASLY